MFALVIGCIWLDIFINSNKFKWSKFTRTLIFGDHGLNFKDTGDQVHTNYSSPRQHYQTRLRAGFPTVGHSSAYAKKKKKVVFQLQIL